MTKGWLSLIGFVVLLGLILFGGPRLSNYLNARYRENINRNGAFCVAEVIQKRTHKGNSVHFRYKYKGAIYKNHEQDDSLFNSVSIGDSIKILLDSTNPGNSYVVPN